MRGRSPRARLELTISVMVVLYVAAIAVMLRLSPLLPARAVGDLDRTFRETWRQTRGNTWRLFWGLLVCAFLPLIIVQIAVVIVFGFPNAQLLSSGAFATRFGITNVINVICSVLTAPISANFMALAYLHSFSRSQIDVFD